MRLESQGIRALLLSQVHPRHCALNVPNTKSIQQQLTCVCRWQQGGARNLVPEIWEVTHVSEEELETTEGGGVDFLAEILELVGWPQVNDEQTEKDLS